MEIIGVVALVLSGCAIGIAFFISGPSGVQGLPPEYKWDGTSLSFMNPNGTWGNPVDLRGETGGTGSIGSPGPVGPIGPSGGIGLTPGHEWNGTRVRFQNSNGSWGNWSDLRGVNGIDGIDYINHNPSVSIIQNTGTYVMSPNNSSFTRFKYILKISVDDLDDDMVQTKVFYRFNISDVWVEGAIFFDTNLTLMISRFIDLLVPVNTTIFWGVQLWDGCDIVMSYMDCTVEFI
jgi:hypothetical protein